MADYRDLLTGVVNKAKEIAASDTVTGIVDKVKDVAETTGVKEVYEKGASRAKSFGSATKRSWELREEYAERERIFAEIGKLFYEQCDAAPDAFYAALFQQLKAVETQIEAKEAEIKAYKEQFAPESAQKDELQNDILDFDAIVNSTAADGSGDSDKT
ncbi:MAG: hypothetical protein IKT07_11140 [Oscillospiraceae bacterium]|nr:hypothetical protein [Oscillospiraceae bacterium]